MPVIAISEAGGEMLFRLSIAISSNYGSRGGMIGCIGFLVDSIMTITSLPWIIFFFFGNTVNFEISNSINSIENEYE